MGFMGTFYPGMKVNPLDLSPNYAGTFNFYDIHAIHNINCNRFARYTHGYNQWNRSYNWNLIALHCN